LFFHHGWLNIHLPPFVAIFIFPITFIIPGAPTRAPMKSQYYRIEENHSGQYRTIETNMNCVPVANGLFLVFAFERILDKW
jgi:hypothetical protein